MLVIAVLCGYLIVSSNAAYAGDKLLRQKRSGSDGEDGQAYDVTGGERIHDIGMNENPSHDIGQPKAGVHNVDINNHYVIKRSNDDDVTEEGSGEARSGAINAESNTSEDDSDTQARTDGNGVSTDKGGSGMSNTEPSVTQTYDERHPQKKPLYTSNVKATMEVIPEDESFDNLKGLKTADTDEKFKEEIQKKFKKIEYTTTQGPECPTTNHQWHCFGKGLECTDIGGVLDFKYRCTLPLHTGHICCYLPNSPTPSQLPQIFFK